MSLIVVVAIVIVLFGVIINDMRRFKIANAAVVALLYLCLLQFLVQVDWRIATVHAAFAALAFALLLIAFHRGLLGGGDTKLMTLAFFNLGPESALVFSFFMLLLTLLYWSGAMLGLFPACRIGGGFKIPFGPSIGGAWIATLATDLALPNADHSYR